MSSMYPLSLMINYLHILKIAQFSVWGRALQQKGRIMFLDFKYLPVSTGSLWALIVNFVIAHLSFWSAHSERYGDNPKRTFIQFRTWGEPILTLFIPDTLSFFT